MSGGSRYRFKTTCGRRVVIEGQFFGLGREIYGERVYAPTRDFIVGPGDRVVDLGAHVGVFSLDAASCGARVLAVEAQSEFLPLLRKHLRINGLEQNVVTEHAIVGSGSGLFADEKKRVRASHWLVSPPSVSVADLCTKHEFGDIDLMKTDIEGSEFALFEELERDLMFPRIRRIVLEAHPEYGEPQLLIRKLQSEKFTTFASPAGLLGRQLFIYGVK